MMMRAGGGKKVKGGCVCEREREREREGAAGRPPHAYQVEPY